MGRYQFLVFLNWILVSQNGSTRGGRIRNVKWLWCALMLELVWRHYQYALTWPLQGKKVRLLVDLSSFQVSIWIMKSKGLQRWSLQPKGPFSMPGQLHLIKLHSMNLSFFESLLTLGLYGDTNWIWHFCAAGAVMEDHSLVSFCLVVALNISRGGETIETVQLSRWIWMVSWTGLAPHLSVTQLTSWSEKKPFPSRRVKASPWFSREQRAMRGKAKGWYWNRETPRSGQVKQRVRHVLRPLQNFHSWPWVPWGELTPLPQLQLHRTGW